MSSSQSPFLSLAPATSSGYPQAPKPATSAPLTKGALADVSEKLALKERSGSMSSDGSNPAKSTSGLRFLKLGPVHFGEHPDGQKEDWHDVAVVE